MNQYVVNKSALTNVSSNEERKSFLRFLFNKNLYKRFAEVMTVKAWFFLTILLLVCCSLAPGVIPLLALVFTHFIVSFFIKTDVKEISNVESLPVADDAVQTIVVPRDSDGYLTAIPEGVVANKVSMKSAKGLTKYYFYFYKLEGKEYTRTVKVSRSSSKFGNSERIKQELPLFHGSIHGAIKVLEDKGEFGNKTRASKNTKSGTDSKAVKGVKSRTAVEKREADEDSIETLQGKVISAAMQKYKGYKGGKDYESFTVNIETPEGTIGSMKGVELQNQYTDEGVNINDEVIITKTVSKQAKGIKNLYSILVLK